MLATYDCVNWVQAMSTPAGTPVDLCWPKYSMIKSNPPTATNINSLHSSVPGHHFSADYMCIPSLWYQRIRPVTRYPERPLFRFLWGYHFSAFLVMMFWGFWSVCPIQSQVFLLISFSDGSWCLFPDRLSLLMACQRIWCVLLRQQFMKVCIFLMVKFVILQVLAP